MSRKFCGVLVLLAATAPLGGCAGSAGIMTNGGKIVQDRADTKITHINPYADEFTEESKAIFSYDPASGILIDDEGEYKVYFPEMPRTFGGDPFAWGNSSFSRSGRYLCWKWEGNDLTLKIMHRINRDITQEQPQVLIGQLNKRLDHYHRQLHFNESAARYPRQTAEGLWYMDVSGTGTESGKPMRLRVVFNPNRSQEYVLIAAGGQERINGPESNKFFDSIALVPRGTVKAQTPEGQRVENACRKFTDALKSYGPSQYAAGFARDALSIHGEDGEAAQAIRDVLQRQLGQNWRVGLDGGGREQMNYVIENTLNRQETRFYLRNDGTYERFAVRAL
ncbi:MAG TPA: hypothetical protein V6D17_20180 [Candidatus Obscuribacterales bacterium]